MKRNLKNEMKSYFAQHGIIFNLSPKALQRRLKKLLGNKRYEDLCTLEGKAEHCNVSFQTLLDFMETADELHAHRSSDSNAILENAAYVYSRILPQIKANMTIADLGCCTGCFVGWVAMEHPDCTVVGIDCNQKALRFARQLVTAPNARITDWDYGQGTSPPVEPCDMLVSIFGINAITDADAPRSFDVTRLRDCDYHRSHKDRYIPYFASWRQLIKPAKSLLMVDRTAGVEDGLAIIDAAHEAGWSVNLSDCSFIHVDNQCFPAFSFLAEKAAAPSEAEVLALFAHANLYQHIEGECAIALYRSLGPKQALQNQHQTYPDGHAVSREIGMAGSLAYCFTRGTRGVTELRLAPVFEKDKWTDQTAPCAAHTAGTSG